MNDTQLTHPDVCRRCATVGRTCCAVSSGDEEFCFPVSAAEMTAIRKAGESGECFVAAANTAGFIEQLTLLLPGYDVVGAFPPQGSHWRLATAADGRCVFLGANGCRLDRSVRPVYCRLFPLWFFSGRLTWFTAEECLANRECASLAKMLRAMGTDSAEVKALHREMCAKLGVNAVQG